MSKPALFALVTGRKKLSQTLLQLSGSGVLSFVGKPGFASSLALSGVGILSAVKFGDYDVVVLADSPHAYWKTTGLSNGASNVPDSSGNARNATFQDGTGWTVGGAAIFPPLSESITWAGSSGHYIFFNSATLSSFSIEVVSKPSSIASGDSGIWDHNGGQRSLTVSPTGVIGFNPGSTVQSSVAGIIAAGSAYHLVATYNQATGAYAIYVNGVLVLSGTTTTGLSAANFMRFPWFTANGNEMPGQFSHWAIYSTALSAARVLAHYNALSPYATMVLLDAPIGYWRLADLAGATTVVDSSGNARNGAATAGSSMPTFQTAGLLTGDPDTAASFDGGDHITVADNAAWDVTNYSITAVIKTSSAAIGAILYRDDIGRSFQFGLTAAGLLKVTHINGANPSVTSTTAVNNGVKHHVAITYDGSNMRLYIDGVADGVTATATGPKVGSDILGIGYRSGTGTETFNGVIDELAFFNTALGAARIAAQAGLI